MRARRTSPALLLAGLALTASVAACGPSIPTRFVLERDIEGWSYRRYQRVLDVEVAVEGDPAVGHTATYVQRARRTSRSVPYANVFVSVYERPTGLALELRRQVRALASYETELRDFGGGRVWHLDAGPGDRWVLWVSGNHIVKVGVSDGEVPEEIVSAYMGLYSSDLDEHGRAQEGRSSGGELPAPQAQSAEGSSEDDDVPDFLRENAPR